MVFQRANQHFHEKGTQATSKVDKLIKALEEDQIPVVCMCSQISVAQGRGSLEAIMLQNFDFVANDTHNSHFRWSSSGGYSPVNWDDKKQLLAAFAAGCHSALQRGLLKTKAEDFFATATGSGAELLNQYLVQSRAAFNWL